MVDYTFTDAVSAAFRIGGDQNHKSTALPNDVKFTFAPTYIVSKNLSVRAEISYVNTAGSTTPNTTSYGVQGVFKF